MSINKLSIGKRRGLQSSSTSKYVFSVLAFDHRQSFVKMLPAETAADVGYLDASSAKLDVVANIASSSSAVLLDPLYSVSQVIANDVLPSETGLIAALEKSGYTGDSTARVTEMMPEWTVEKIKRMGADAVKLLIYYHPDAGALTEKQEALTSEIIKQCRKLDTAFFLEPVTYSINPNHGKSSNQYASIRTDNIVRMVKRLGNLGPDVLKIEFPVDSNLEGDRTVWEDACQAVTDASPCPWTVLSAGVNFELFEEQVEVACKAGASGFIGGRAVWKEGIPMQSKERNIWLQTTAKDRMEKLSRIADEYAQPWTAYYPAQNVSEYQDWYLKYGNIR